MIIHIVAGGPEYLLPDLIQYDSENITWVGVDRGVLHLLKRKIKPMIAFGDFDSVTKEELWYLSSEIKDLKKFHPEKNETDMELALNWSLQQNPDEIRLFGASGGRLDHMMANIQLLFPPVNAKHTVQISMIDCYNHLCLKSPGSYQIKYNPIYKYISFLPITVDVEGLTLEGFKYPLKNRHISLGSTLCISNELIDSYGTFSFSKGILLVIRSHD